MNKVKEFIRLQDKANEEIDLLGQTTNETFEALNKVADSLNAEEIDEVIKAYENKRK